MKAWLFVSLLLALGVLAAACDTEEPAPVAAPRPPTPTPLPVPGQPPTPLPIVGIGAPFPPRVLTPSTATATATATAGEPSPATPTATATAAEPTSATATPGAAPSTPAVPAGQPTPTPGSSPGPAAPTSTPGPGEGPDAPEPAPGSPTPSPTETPPPFVELTFSQPKVGGVEPSQVQMVFSLRDDADHSFILSPDDLRAATRVFEMGPGTQGWEEIDYSETSYFVSSAENFELEVVFVLDFTNSMALGRLEDGRTGIQGMLDAFELAVTSLPGAHRIGVVEFHDRNVDPGILSSLTTNREATIEAVTAFANSSFDSGSSRVWDSISTATELFTSGEDNPDVIRTIVFLSDGRDTSSQLNRSDVGEIASTNLIQLYALGIGDVFEEELLAAMVQSAGGVYYPTRELDALQDQLAVLVNDLRGQYKVTYTTLRREGTYRTKLEVNLPEAVGVFEGPPLAGC